MRFIPTQGESTVIAVPQLHLVTPADIDESVLDAVSTAIAAGAPLIQVRTKDAVDRRRLATVRAVADRVRDGGATLIVNDRVDLALAVGADGVHLGDDDLPVEVARAMLGPAAIIGATCRNPDAARAAVAAGASYLGVGPAYATVTKDVAHPPIGAVGVGAVAAAVDVPVIAIAGVTAGRVDELRAAGAHGVAVVGAVFGADDVARATKEFLAALDIGR